jgi:hypothetical protein
MTWLSRLLVIAVSAAVLAAPSLRAVAQDAGKEPGEGAEAPAAPKPAELYEQLDRKRTMSIKLPRAWKAATGEDATQGAIATFGGFFGEENNSPNGRVDFITYGNYQRASLARAVVLPQVGPVKPESLHQEAGWAQGCAVGDQVAQWYRFVEKNGHVYGFVVSAHGRAYDTVRETVEHLLATATVPGEYGAPPLGDAFTKRKVGAFDVTTDVEADREGSVKHACELLATAREIAAKALPGKPFDASKPAAWVFQNTTRFDDRAKAAGLGEVKYGVFNPSDRCAMVSILGETAQGNDEAVYRAGAGQYVWQYFGGSPPIWVDVGIREYTTAWALGGGKKLQAEYVSRTKSAIAAGKRRLDQWFDVASWAEVKDDNQGALELLGWQAYFRVGRGSKKLRKNFEAYLQTLRDSGDPAVARKAFDGVNFDELLQDFKAWGNDWKQ